MLLKCEVDLFWFSGAESLANHTFLVMPHFIRDPYKVLLSNFVCIYFFPVSYPTFTTIENHSHIVIKYPFLTCSYKMYIVSYAHVIDFCKVYCAARDYFSPSLLLLVPVLLLRMCMTGDVVHQHTSPLYPPSDKNPTGPRNARVSKRS